MRLRLAATLITVGIGNLPFAQPSHAQQPPGEPGDYFWQLVPDGLLADGRIEQALVLMVDAEAVSDEAGVDGTLWYGQPEGQAVLEQAPREDIPLLFAAAGFDDPGSQIVVQRDCLFWTPSGDGEADATAVATALGAALASGLSELGVSIEGCQACRCRFQRRRSTTRAPDTNIHRT